MTGRCADCLVPAGVACFAAGLGLSEWCDRADLRKVALGRSLGWIVDRPRDAAEQEAAEQEAREAARACPHADRPWDGCACVDRLCSRHDKIVSGLDCLLCHRSAIAP